MTRLQESAALVVLLRCGGRTWSEYAELVEEAGSAVAVLERERQPSLFGSDDLTEAESQVASWERSGFHLVSVLDSDYPDNLRAVHDRPPLIFVAGRMTPADDQAVAVVGTRTASPAGIRAAGKIAAHLVASGFTVASGLATGIDTAAHRAAIANGGRTIAVIGTGLGRVYPAQNAQLQAQIAARFAVVSQFWPNSPPTKRTFPMRNGLMSGLSLATVIVEAGETSGARIQARLALAQGRPVFLSDSLLRHDWGRGYARRPGVYVFEEPSQITEAVRRITAPGKLTA